MEKSEAWYGATLATIRKINPEAVLMYMVEAGDGNPAEETINKISRAFGIGTGDVWQIIRRNGLLERLEDIMFGKKVDDNQVMELYQKGYSDNKIADVCGVKGPTIFAWRKKRELPPNIAPACPGSRTEMRAQGKLAAAQDHEKIRKPIDEAKKANRTQNQNMAIQARETIEKGVVPVDWHNDVYETIQKRYIDLLGRTRWIPVSERLPEEKDANEFGYVLVVTRYGSVRTDKAEWVADKEGRKFFTHWMPLPEPPQGVE